MEEKGMRTTIWLTEASHEKLRKFAYDSRMTHSDVIRQALELLYASGQTLSATSSVYPRRTVGTGRSSGTYTGEDGLVHEKYE